MHAYFTNLHFCTVHRDNKDIVFNLKLVFKSLYFQAAKTKGQNKLEAAYKRPLNLENLTPFLPLLSDKKQKRV